MIVSRRFRRRAAVIAVLTLSLFIAQCERSYGKQACRMEREILLAGTDRAPSDVAVTAGPKGGYVVAYSADGATHTLFLDKDHRPTDPVYLVPGPTGGGHAPLADKKTFWPSTTRPSMEAEDLDLIFIDKERLLLVTLELPTEGTLGGAFATLLSAEGAPLKTVRLGSAGEYGTEIAVTLWDDTVLTAWHDGTLNASKISLALLDPKDLRIIHRADFKGKGTVAGPTLAVFQGRPFIAWSETGNLGSEPVSTVDTAWISRDLTVSTPKTVAEGRFLFPFESQSG